MDIRQQARELLDELDRAAMTNTAYDTAWVARVPGHNGASSETAFPQAIDWLRRHQYPDGSWGSNIHYYHDRIISTLAALIALAERGQQTQDRQAIERGERYIHKNIRHLHYDPHETVGFELILPTLMDKARLLELDLPYDRCERYRHIREEKLRRIPTQLIHSRRVTTTHSLEFMGDGLDIDRAGDLQEENGSIGNSPSATAYVLAEYDDEPRARNYLAQTIDLGGGAVMPAHPVEIFDKSWVLYNLDVAGLLDEVRDEAQVHLDYLYATWDAQQGVGFSHYYSVPDLDDTAVVFKLLANAGYAVDPDVFLHYEREDHFVCYPFERNPSIGAHIHLLDALRACHGHRHGERMVNKALAFYRQQLYNAYWFDKWHISPYYLLSHAVMATIGRDNALARECVNWIVDTQRNDGTWGYFCSTSEETAYCMQALIAYHRDVSPLDETLFHHAARSLYEHYASRYHPALWIEKCLYTPEHIVRSAILSALWMYESFV